MQKKIIIGNWKMHKTSKEANEFLDIIDKMWKIENLKFPKNLQSGLAVPATLLKQIADRKSAIKLIVAQNVHFEKEGAFTGELSIDMIKEAGANAVIIGHSERRKMFNEIDETINKKIKIALKNKITPIVCIGETLKQYEKGQTKEIIKNSINKSFKNINQWQKIIIAYEPIWAIGTGKTATIEYAQKLCKFIRSITSNEVMIQYGGSVNPHNIQDLMNQIDIDGVLVGSASLDPYSFMKLLTLNK